MGLQPWVGMVAWTITYGIMFTAVSLVVTVTCTLSFLPGTDPFLLFVLLLLFTMSELAFGLMVASVFSNAKAAAICGPLAHFAALVPRFIVYRCRLTL